MSELSEKQIHYIDELIAQFNPSQPGTIFSARYEEYIQQGKIKKVYRIYQNENLCVEISISDNEDSQNVILILGINKCTPSGLVGSGTYNINRMIKFANKNDLSLVIEYDVSKIRVGDKEFSLAGLYLLSTGKTWYNSLGFYERSYAKNKRLTDEFISQYTWTNTAEFKEFIYKPMLAKKTPSPDTASSMKSPGGGTASSNKTKKSKDKINFTIKKTFKYVFDRLKNKDDPPSAAELKFYAKFVKAYQTKLLNDDLPIEERIEYKTYSLTYMTEEPTE